MEHVPRYLITTAKHAVKKEPDIWESIYLFVKFFHVQKNQSICDKIAFLYLT